MHTGIRFTTAPGWTTESCGYFTVTTIPAVPAPFCAAARCCTSPSAAENVNLLQDTVTGETNSLVPHGPTRTLIADGAAACLTKTAMKS